LSWDDDIKDVFPNWQTEEGIAEFNAAKVRLEMNQFVTGTVIARAQFGVWVDIGVGYPALLLVVNFANRDAKAQNFFGYPMVGEKIEAYVNALGPRAEIGLTQRN
jgi:transcriptional accessory protein Tex/SPT6